MDTFIRAAGGVLITCVLCLSLSKQGKDISLLLSLAVCCMVLTAGAVYLQPIIEFFSRLQILGQLDSAMLKILLKAVGIGLLAEIAGLLCADAGNAAVGKTLQFLATAAVLWLSIPLFTEMIDLLEKVLGAI